MIFIIILKISKDHLSSIYPRKYKITKGENIKQGSNKLRKTDSYEMYISVKIKNRIETDRVVLPYYIH